MRPVVGAHLIVAARVRCGFIYVEEFPTPRVGESNISQFGWSRSARRAGVCFRQAASRESHGCTVHHSTLVNEDLGRRGRSGRRIANASNPMKAIVAQTCNYSLVVDCL